MDPLALETLAVLFGVPTLYWALPARWALWLVVAATCGVLLVLSPQSLVALSALTLATHAFARSRLVRGNAVFAGVGAILLALLGYKLWVREVTGGQLPSAALWLGFSYYTLRAIHYLIERFRGGLPEHGATELVQYMFFLPVLPGGPIHRFGDFVREVRRRRWDAARLSRGLERILFGYAKIVLLANYAVTQKLAGVVEGLQDTRQSLAAYLECVQYGADLYFRFAGVSDIAIGFALLLGIRVIENFDHPLLARNISEFWTRWHISLSSFCRDYIYMPVAAATRSPALAVVASMLVLGLWHELSFRYLAWGAYHGLGIVVSHLFGKLVAGSARLGSSMPSWVGRVLGVVITLNFVILSFAITKEPDLSGTLDVLRRMSLMRF